MSVVGVDGCKSGWIAVVIRDGSVYVHHLSGIEVLAEKIPDVEAIAIDIPIGLLEVGKRTADLAAMKELHKRANTVFLAPVRHVLSADSYLEANELSKQVGGYGLSRQAYALFPKIRQVDEWLSSAPCPVWEIHPELSFAKLNESVPLPSKRSWTGMMMRREILKRVGIDLDHVAGSVGEEASVDDMLDAGIAAHTAWEILARRAQPIPETPEFDSKGREIAIWV